MYVESNTGVLLRTAQSLVGKVGSVMDQKHKTRIVFDSCSQRSYISNRMRNTLNLETVESENLLVKTFGDEASKVLACDKVQLAVIDTKGNDIMMEAYCVPTICSPISNQSIKVALEEYPHLCETNVITKRSILSVAAKIYDPLGLISPVTLRFKQMFQELCKSKVDWDEPLNDEFCEEWNQIIEKLKEASHLSIRRCYCPELFGSEVKSTELHSFGDASESSYGACVYLRCEHLEGIHCDLIASKTRVAPMSKQTIRRLELLSSLLASRYIDRKCKESYGRG